jgi:hypothetical protein
MTTDKAVPAYLWTDKQRAYVLRLEAVNAELVAALEAALPYLRPWGGLSLDVNKAIMRAACTVRGTIEKARSA